MVGASLASQELPLEHRLLPLLAERSSFSFFSSSLLVIYLREVSLYQVLAELSLAHELRSTQQRSAALAQQR